MRTAQIGPDLRLRMAFHGNSVNAVAIEMIYELNILVTQVITEFRLSNLNN